MPMPLNGRFIEKYGQSWSQMDDREKQMALMSEIFDLREDMEPVKSHLSSVCKTVENHKTYFRGIWVAISLIAIPVIGAIIKFIMGI